MMQSAHVASHVEGDRLSVWIARHWLAVVNGAWGLLVGLPWLAPVAMWAGWTRVADVLYFIYSFLCHQYANRSFFLFGPKRMYAYTEFLPYAPDANTFAGLRAFRGTPELGYKVAWSDRMVWLYGGIFVVGVIYALLRKRTRPLSWRLFVLMLVPLALDGSTHVVSDLFGVGNGFRYTNAWLAALTGQAFSPQFYVGNAVGSFNFLMRLFTGVLAAIAIVWAIYPRVDRVFAPVMVYRERQK